MPLRRPRSSPSTAWSWCATPPASPVWTTWRHSSIPRRAVAHHGARVGLGTRLRGRAPGRAAQAPRRDDRHRRGRGPRPGSRRAARHARWVDDQLDASEITLDRGAGPRGRPPGRRRRAHRHPARHARARSAPEPAWERRRRAVPRRSRRRALVGAHRRHRRGGPGGCARPAASHDRRRRDASAPGDGHAAHPLRPHPPPGRSRRRTTRRPPRCSA